MSGKTVSVFDFENYREYLRAAYAELKLRKQGFSFRAFSRAAGFSSPSVLKGVMDGKRNIAPSSIAKFARALRLNHEQTQYFENLVLMNQSKTIDESRAYAERLLASRKLRKLRPLAPAQFDYYSHWYVVPVRELVGVPGFREDPEWIARQLTPEISGYQAKKALEILLSLGLLRRDETGRLVQADAGVSTGDEVASIAICLWHQQMMSKAAESIDRHEYEKRDISAVTISVPEDLLPQIKQMIQRFRKSIIEECSKHAGSEEVVYQLGIQLFPVTRSLRKAGK